MNGEGSKLTLKNGATVRDNMCSNNNTTCTGGGVALSKTGGSAPAPRFTMNGGSISGNYAARYGGGLYVSFLGIFTMNGGAITDNTAGYGGQNAARNTTNSTFTQNGGTITGGMGVYNP